jgi:hypothetical protein
MKNFSKMSSVAMVAAIAAAFSISVSGADEVVIKPLRYQSPKSVFTETVTPPSTMKCPACTESFKPVVTQDSKLTTKTVLVAEHGCKECKTTIARVGAQKATGKDVRQHTCGALLAAVENCCGGMK